jgi:hypothetical protein
MVRCRTGNGSTLVYRRRPRSRRPHMTRAPAARERVLFERIVFAEEADPSSRIKLIACGDIDEAALDALDAYIGRQRKRMSAQRAVSGG